MAKHGLKKKTGEIPWLNRLQQFPPAPVQWPSTERSEPEPVEAGPFSGFHGISGKNRTCLFNNSFIRPKCPKFVNSMGFLIPVWWLWNLRGFEFFLLVRKIWSEALSRWWTRSGWIAWRRKNTNLDGIGQQWGFNMVEFTRIWALTTNRDSTNKDLPNVAI